MTRRRRHFAGESGATVLEVVVAAFFLVLLLAAAAGMMVNNNKAALANQRQTQLISILQQRIEYVHEVFTQYYPSLGFSGLALSSNPAQGVDVTTPSNPTDPNDFITPYVSGFVTATSGTAEKFLIEANYNQTAQGTIDGGTTFAETLQVDPTNGKIAPVTYVDLTTGTTYTSIGSLPAGDPYATVYTYVTQAVTGANASLSACATGTTGSSTGDARRVIVAAKLYSPRVDNIGSKPPQYASTLINDPVPANACQAASGLRIGLNIL